MTASTKEERKAERRKLKATPVWFWKPQLFWHGWKTLIPFVYGHDEYARRTIMLGWTITGRIIIAVWECGSVHECWDEPEYARERYAIYEDEQE